MNCPTCGCKLYKENGACHGSDAVKRIFDIVDHHDPVWYRDWCEREGDYAELFTKFDEIRPR